MTIVEFEVNGRNERIDVVPGATLLTVLRETLHLTGTKEGCLEGECGACTVLMDGQPVDSCLVAVHTLGGHHITTIEGVTDVDTPNDLQESMVRYGGVQCGFCTPGVVMTLTALRSENPAPSEAEIRLALAGNLCRCTGYAQIVDAVVAVTKERTE